MQRRHVDRRSAIGVWVGNLPGPLAALNRFSITRYLIASIISLAFDVALFMVLVAMFVDAGFASAIGYSAGIGVHWLISSSFVFPGKKRDGAALQYQRLGFIASAVLGLVITVGIVEAMTLAGSAPVIAKAAAIFVSFFAVYALRRWAIFK